MPPAEEEKKKAGTARGAPVSNGTHELHEDSFVLSLAPVRTSFLYQFLLAFVPVVLVIVSVIVRGILESLFEVGSSSISSAVPATLAPFTTGVVSGYSASIADATTITILLIAPVGIFLLVMAIGWAMRATALWTGALLTLALSGCAALVLTPVPGSAAAWGNYGILYLQWVTFLVQPFSIVAAALVILGTEKFRRSIEYRITPKGIRIRGGFASLQEHIIPHGQVGRVVFEQDYFGALCNYATLIPYTTTRWGTETSIRGIGAAGQKNNTIIGMGYARGREEGSRHPLDCLFGVPDPIHVQEILSEFMCRADGRGEEQVAYLKKLYEVSVEQAQAVPDALLRMSARETAAGRPSPAGNPGFAGAGGNACGTGPVIRVTELDPPGARALSTDDSVREIPPLAGTTGRPVTTPAPAPESPLDQLGKLAGLRDAGIITDEEFAAKKAELLRRV
jgi:hypothetical protein